MRAALHALDDSCTHVAVHDAATVDRRRPHGPHGRGRGQDSGGHPRRLGSRHPQRVSSESRDLGESADAIIDDILGDAGRVSADARVVEATVDRDQLVPSNPQCFARDTLVQAYAQESLPQTDDAGIWRPKASKCWSLKATPATSKSPPERISWWRKPC